ncbi:sulfate adenylyltransferase subunit CysD [Gordonia sp. NPDC003376]
MTTELTASTEPATAADRSTTDGPADVDHVAALRILEAESVHIIREVAAELERPVLLFSGGKDSIVLLRLAEKAFRPSPLPFPILHVDTGHNFDEVIEFRDRRVAPTADNPDGIKLIVASVPDAIEAGRIAETTDPSGSRNRLQTPVLLEALEAGGFDAAFGGARRDEDRARAKERVFSFRDEFGQWDPRAQRPEPWSLYNGRIRRGESVRVFPLSNWTELDIWRYIQLEDLELPSIYYAAQREVFDRDGILLAVSEYSQPDSPSEVSTEWVRYRTVGDLTITGAVRSQATTLDEIIGEISVATVSERGETRADDRTSSAAMEDRKREGYF